MGRWSRDLPCKGCCNHGVPGGEGSGCKLCPRDWLLHGDKCYWLSKERKDWTGSRDDCSGKSSRMLVIQNREEMDFIQDVVQDANYIWIGLKVTPPGGKWTWVDGSPLDPVRCMCFNDHRIFSFPEASEA
ncbi:killer cell lectin-like receptor subfamily F member 1 isoform X4 [Caretta caretta]|uniref:killer cell lectin-like receptor subfamily F member 1 isoform X4 n=1 Tax=Caretta caretta TaxID=8467 RepID=UPI003F4BBB1E